MLFIPKTDGYLKILTDEEVKDFVAINFGEYFTSIREEQNLRKVAKLVYIFPKTPDEVEKYVELHYSDDCVHHSKFEILNIFFSKLQLINTKPLIKSKLKEFLSELKNV